MAASPQHTHLSVSFGLSAPGAPVGRDTLQDVISVQRDFTVEPARNDERYLNEEIRVEKSDNSTYKMVIARVRAQDAGTYHCTAAQWIQDPDGGWQKITEKRSVLAQVSVQTVGEAHPPHTALQPLHEAREVSAHAHPSLSFQTLN